MPRATREVGPSLSMPAAEVFAAVAVAAAVAAHARVDAVIAVGDYQPAIITRKRLVVLRHLASRIHWHALLPSDDEGFIVPCPSLSAFFRDLRPG